MSQITVERLAELTIQALERIAFLIGDRVEIDAGALAHASHAATIAYSGSGSGTITLNAGDDFLRALAASLLGVEPDEVELGTHGQDAIKELTNIIAGSVIAELGGRELPFTLGLPSLAARPATTDAAGNAGCQRCCLDCEGQFLFVTWAPSVPASSLAA